MSDSTTAAAGELVLLKLGGSLITDKRQAETARLEVISRLAQEIARACAANPQLQLVIGHGSGSFGHVVGQRYGTRAGASSPTDWYGFAATADVAARLNRIVVAALLRADVPAWSIQPSVALRCADGVVVDGPHATVAAALQRGLVPVVFGDVALDEVRGGTIASTEEIFAWLIPRLQPQRLILAGEVDGIYTADPQLVSHAERIPVISPSTIQEIAADLGDSHGIDVTGGMQAKVSQALTMAAQNPHLSIRICGGLTSGQIERALVDSTAPVGTLICR